MYKRTENEIDEKVQQFVKWVWDNYKNPGVIPKILQYYFEEMENIKCGFTYGPGEYEWGHVDCFYIIDGEARGFLKEGTYSHNDKQSLTDFIFNNFNPTGLFVLEKIMFDQT